MNPPIRREAKHFDEVVRIGLNKGLLPCGHQPFSEDDRIITDQCFECDWVTPYRALANKVNDAAADRGAAETHLIGLARATGDKEQLTNDDFNEIVKQAIRIGLKFGREEALRYKLNNFDEE